MVKRNNQWYRIRQVAEQTGLSPQLIRQWEARYQAIVPRRLENGYRVYHQDDIDRLRQLKHLVDDGYSIKNAVLFLQDLSRSQHAPAPVTADLTDKVDIPEMQQPYVHVNRESSGLQTTKAEGGTFDQPAPAPLGHINERVVRELLRYGRDSDTSRIAALLDMTLSMHGIHHLIYAVMIPFLRKIGELWERGDWTEYQEHIASLQVRDFLVHFRSHLHVPDNGPLLLASCVPGERHEIMLQIILVEAAVRRWRTNFLGTSPAPQALTDAVRHLEPNKVVLSVTTARPWTEHPQFLKSLSNLSTTHQDTSFYIGGPGMDELMAEQLGDVTWVQTIEEFLPEIPQQQR